MVIFHSYVSLPEGNMIKPPNMIGDITNKHEKYNFNDIYIYITGAFVLISPCITVTDAPWQWLYPKL